MKIQNKRRMNFVFPEKICEMLEKIADFNMTTKTAVLKSLIIKTYESCCSKDTNRNCR